MQRDRASKIGVLEASARMVRLSDLYANSEEVGLSVNPLAADANREQFNSAHCLLRGNAAVLRAEVAVVNSTAACKTL
jgi:hypothetical protein